ncbi:DinB family protein [Siminovitchia sp. FSL H7-0308]|uniref:DinB-like domain-containing protein n=1 Tax=Siminovitchia thermophila TaxID=1245522 RepID=A0ABS2R6K1_9BACI|nr:DinB family protein [Siminovitchia thermophila]MBM7715281.1 hypothetical protein [Siminovitchia thermophila]
MNSLRQFQLFRGLTLQVLEDLKETKWDAQHPGQPNTICWNTGHLYITSEFLMNKTDHHYEVHQPEWSAFFAPGTRPSDDGRTAIPCQHNRSIERTTEAANHRLFFRQTAK